MSSIPHAHPQPQSRARRSAARRPQTRRSNTMLWVLGGLAAVAGLLLFALTALVGVGMLRTQRAPDGVRVGDVLVGGLPLARAADAVAAAYDGRAVLLADGNRTWSRTLAELGIRVDAASSANATLGAARGDTVPPSYNVDLAQTQQTLIALSEEANVEPVGGDAAQPGRAMDIPATLERLRAGLAAELSDGIIALDMLVLDPPAPEPMVTAPAYDGVTTTHVIAPGDELGLLARRYGVSMADIIALNAITDADMIYVGQTLTIPAAGVYAPSALDAPPAPLAVGRALLISIDRQRIYAYENGQLVRSHLVSTGTDATPTLLGDYRIYAKYEAKDMRGPGYFLPQVPYAMFYDRGYAIHGTYWHNKFGRPMSHGCTNLPVEEAAWFYNFASIGTLVRVI